ncbi:MAG TPA: DUF1203 domain-containing protein [Pyrinomonadaceae bacterium]|jgi:hypothetical protein|nr:DUF1203 domain-containing protein [Pyrinomonadaceae bacterium]
MGYKVVPMPYSLVETARATRMSPQYKGLPAFSAIATGYGPCRSCLKTFNEGEEERLYIAYNPFEGLSGLPLPGHIFIHTEHCDEFNGEGFPTDLLHLPLLLEGYEDDSFVIKREKVDKNDPDAQIEGMLADASIRFLNIRNAEAGCFIARIDRAD